MVEQDSRLARAYFSPNYKYFDQLVQTVKNETTVLNLVFKGFFTNINSTTDLYILCKRGVITIFRWKIFVLQCRKIS